MKDWSNDPAAPWAEALTTELHLAPKILFENTFLWLNQTKWQTESYLITLINENEPNLTSLHSSTRMKNKSKRDMMGADIAMFCLSDFDLSYRPFTGFAAASIEVLAFSVACKNNQCTSGIKTFLNVGQGQIYIWAEVCPPPPPSSKKNLKNYTHGGRGSAAPWPRGWPPDPSAPSCRTRQSAAP